jgi:hypothetical protein
MRLARNICLAIAAIAVVPGLLAAAGNSSQPFTITISAPQATIKVGDPVRIHVVFTNVSNQESNLQTMFGAECDYIIHIQDKNGLHTHEPDCSGSSVSTHRKPGMKLEYDADLSKILQYDSKVGDMVKTFDFTWPGEYVIQLSRHISDDPDKEVVKSNNLTITVTE